ncbi:MAG TPA: peroxiredoxin [Rubricoccaceae bacterium]|jgi:peroxiredoxin|nr:peroxiredoxin [Rubricoccaceae bacterium]
MSLSVGDPAPDFTLYDDERRPWTLSDHRGHAVVLLFFPGAFTSVCTTEMNVVNNDLARYSGGGARVAGISTDSPDVLAEFKAVNDLRFPLLSDHDAEVAEAYGVRFTREEHRLGFSRVAKRAVFVVDGGGRIVHVEVLAHPGLEPDYDALLEAVDGVA